MDEKVERLFESYKLMDDLQKKQLAISGMQAQQNREYAKNKYFPDEDDDWLTLIDNYMYHFNYTIFSAYICQGSFFELALAFFFFVGVFFLGFIFLTLSCLIFGSSV